jgi:hypothetical protein
MENYTVTSSLGPLELTPTDSGHIHASTARNSVSTVRGVDYRVGIHLYIWSDGLFHIGEESKNTYEQRQSLHAVRPYTGTKQDGTPATEPARARIAQVVTDTVKFFVKSCPEALTSAQRLHLEDKMHRAEHDYAEAMNKVLELCKVRDAAQDVFENFVKESV